MKKNYTFIHIREVWLNLTCSSLKEMGKSIHPVYRKEIDEKHSCGEMHILSIFQVSLKYLLLILWTRQCSICWTGNSVKRNPLGFVKYSVHKFISNSRKKRKTSSSVDLGIEKYKSYITKLCLKWKKWIVEIVNNTDKINQDTLQGRRTKKTPCIGERSLGTMHWTNSIKIMNRNNYSMTLSSTYRSNWQVGRKKNKTEITTVSLRSFTCWSQLAPDHEYKLEHALLDKEKSGKQRVSHQLKTSSYSKFRIWLKEDSSPILSGVPKI